MVIDVENALGTGSLIGAVGLPLFFYAMSKRDSSPAKTPLLHWVVAVIMPEPVLDLINPKSAHFFALFSGIMRKCLKINGFREYQKQRVGERRPFPPTCQTGSLGE